MPRKKHEKKKENASKNAKSKHGNAKNENIKTDVEPKKDKSIKLSRYFNDEQIFEIQSVMKNKFAINMNPLSAAIILNDSEKCTEILREHPSLINEQNEIIDSTPLMLAAKYGPNLKIVEHLLNNGANPWLKDKDGTNSIMHLINNKDISEQDFVAVWKYIKNITTSKLNNVGKCGNSLLHLVVRRQWKQALNTLLKFKNIDVNVQNTKGISPLMMACARNDIISVDKLMDFGAAPLQKDNKGCTALCCTIDLIMKKHIEIPHLCINSMLLFMDDHQKVEYLKERINLIARDPLQGELFNKTLTKIIPNVIRYFMRRIEDGVKLTMEANVFKLLHAAAINHWEKREHIQSIIQVLQEILKIPDVFFGKNFPGLILDKFFDNEGLNTCLIILEKHCHAGDKFLKDIFVVLFSVCSNSEPFCSWIKINSSIIEERYEKHNFEFEEELGRSAHFQTKRDLFETLLQEACLVKLNLSPAQILDSALNPPPMDVFEYAIGQPIIINIEELAYEEIMLPKLMNHEAKHNSKRTKRRTRALKAKITKIKNAELTDRLLLKNNGHASVAKKNASDNGKEMRNIDKTAAEDFFDPKQKTKTVDVGDEIESEDIKESLDDPDEETLSQIQFKFNNEHFWLKTEWNKKLEATNLEFPCNGANIEMQRQKYSHLIETVPMRLQDLLDKESSLDLTNERSSCLTNDFEDAAINDSCPVDSRLTYVNSLFEKLIDFYETKWKMDNEQNYPHLIYGDYLPNDPNRLEKLKSVLPQMEKEYIDKLKVTYKHLIQTFQENRDVDQTRCKRMLWTLEKMFLRHEIRVKKSETSPVRSKSPGGFPNKRNNSLLRENSLTPKHERTINDIKMVPVLTKPSLDPLDSGDDSNFQLVQSVLKAIESDDEESQRLKNWLQLDKRRAAQRYKQQRTNGGESNSVSENSIWEDSNDFSKVSADPAYFPPGFQNVISFNGFGEEEKTIPVSDAIYPIYRSRWSSIVNSAKRSDKIISHLNDELRICTNTKLVDVEVSGEGNFGELSLSFDKNNRPLVVKRVSKRHMDVCRRLTNAVQSVLCLRHQNILHYFLCEYDTEELFLATPLCEFNMGEYLMLTKFSENAHVAIGDMVKQFLIGLNFLHDKNVVHGNMKPSNIFIDITGIVKIAEFGIYKALFQFIEPPNSSQIWFSRETLDVYKEINSIDCSKASDVQVAGMLVHFLLTRGRHAFGEEAEEILQNLLNGRMVLKTKDVIVNDLLSWMLLYDPSDRPALDQVLKHVYFWTTDRKWKFLLACAGVGTYGTPLAMDTAELHEMFDNMAKKERIKGEWVDICQEKFPEYNINMKHSDTPVGILQFLRELVQLDYCYSSDVKDFFLEKFPALPLSLYRMIDMSKWIDHPVFKPFTDLDAVIV